MVVSVTGNGTYTANLHSLKDGSITSALAFTDPENNPVAATGNTVTLDTDKTQVATLVVADTADHVINNTESTAVSFTVGGLDEAGTGTVTFSDGVNPNVVVSVTGNGTYTANLHSLKDGSITSALAFTDPENNTAAATGNTVTLDTDKTQVATLSVDDTADHIINNTESTAVSFTVGGLDEAGTGTVTFSDGVNPNVVVSVTGNGTYTANLHSLKDGSITSALAFTDPENNPAAATGNTVTLDTDKAQVATLVVADTADHIINNTESTAVSFTVGGLDEAGTGTVTFSDGVNPNVVVSVTGNGTYTANLHSLKDGSITSALAFTDPENNTAAATGNTVTLDTDKTQVATLSVNDTADHVINNTESTAVSFTVGGLDEVGTGTVTFSDGVNPNVVVSVTGNGTYTANLSSLNNGSITSALSFTDSEGNPANAAGNSVLLEKNEVPDLAGTLSGLTAGNAVEAQTVTVATLTDGGPSVIGDSNITYSWQVFRNGAWYEEGNQRNFTPSAADFGDQLRVVINYAEQSPESGTDFVILSAGTVQEEPNTGSPGAYAEATSGGNWKTASTWTTNSIPTAATNVEVEVTTGSQGVQVQGLDTDSAKSLNIIGSGALLKDSGTLSVSGALTVINGGELDLNANGTILNAGSITGTITGSANATVQGSASSNVVGPSGTGPWTEIISTATIIESGTKTISGWLAIDSAAILTLTGGGTQAENILFANNFPDNHLDSGTLIVSSGTTFSGTVYGFTAGGGFSDVIDLQGVDFNSGHFTESYNSTTGVLTVNDGTNNATIHFSSFSGAFQFNSDGSHGTLITDPPADSGKATIGSVGLTLSTGVDNIVFVGGTNQVVGTNATANNGDVIHGGTGTDTLTIDTGNGSHNYTFGDGKHADIGITNFENLTLTDPNATSGDAVTVTFDASFQNNGALTVDGSALTHLNGANLTIDAHLATSDSFAIIGSAGADTLIGGSNGNNTITGGGGGDTLTGGGANDTFVFKAITDSQPGAGHFDTITDFTHNSDHIDFAAINGLNSTVQAVSFNSLTAAPANIAAHTIDIVTSGGNKVIYANSTAASETLANASMEIHLTGVTNVASTDFILHH